MVETVDTPSLEVGGESCAGSNPAIRTIKLNTVDAKIGGESNNSNVVRIPRGYCTYADGNLLCLYKIRSNDPACVEMIYTKAVLKRIRYFI